MILLDGKVNNADPNSPWKGDIWSFTVQSKVAYNPTPSDGAKFAATDVTLGWTAGFGAKLHTVYFGDNFDDVNAATGGTYQPAATYVPAPLELGKTYYWRVDEFDNDASVTKGRVWSFKVADYLVVDDIESYNDIDPPNPGSNRVFDKWMDGFLTPTTNGALAGNTLPPYTERGNVHGGAQAMPLSYDDNFKLSEATLTLTAAGRDWTRQGITALSLWFRGAAANAAERMYVALNDTAVVYHTDPAAAQATAWTEWVIPLQQFAGLGVDLTNVTSVTIGFGTRGNTTAAGGTGQMYFDDIRLYRPTTAP